MPLKQWEGHFPAPFSCHFQNNIRYKQLIFSKSYVRYGKIHKTLLFLSLQLLAFLIRMEMLPFSVWALLALISSPGEAICQSFFSHMCQGTGQ